MQIKLTVSSGIANLGKKKLTGEDFIKRADEALYVSKNSGRNMTTVAKK